MTKLNYIWRLFATGFCFAHFFLGGLFLAAVVFPVAYVLPGSKQKKFMRSRLIVHYAFKQFVWQFQFLGVFSVDVQGLENISETKGQLVVANHPSLIDVVILMSLIRDANCIIKSELWRHRYFGGVMRAANYISNSGEPEQLLLDCKHVLDKGQALIIFPEGTRTVNDKKLKFQRGAAHIAAYTNAPILPVVIKCKPATLKKGEPWYKIPAKKAHFSVVIQTSMETNTIIDDKLMPSQASRQLTGYLRDYFQQKMDEE